MIEQTNLKQVKVFVYHLTPVSCQMRLRLATNVRVTPHSSHKKNHRVIRLSYKGNSSKILKQNILDEILTSENHYKIQRIPKI